MVLCINKLCVLDVVAIHPGDLALLQTFLMMKKCLWKPSQGGLNSLGLWFRGNNLYYIPPPHAQASICHVLLAFWNAPRDAEPQKNRKSTELWHTLDNFNDWLYSRFNVKIILSHATLDLPRLFMQQRQRDNVQYKGFFDTHSNTKNVSPLGVELGFWHNSER